MPLQIGWGDGGDTLVLVIGTKVGDTGETLRV